MSDRNKAEIVRCLFAAYLSNDRKAVEDALAEDFRFTSPYDDAIDKATYFERCWRNSDWIERHELEKILVEGDGAFVLNARRDPPPPTPPPRLRGGRGEDTLHGEERVSKP